MTNLLLIALFAGLLCVRAQPPSSGPGDDAPSTDARNVLSSGNETERPGRNEGIFQDSHFLFERPDNETEIKHTEGDRYTWRRDLDTGESVSERAFVPNNSSVIVVKSRDNVLKTRNITRSTSVYAFSDLNSIVAIIPWRRSGPCLIRNTTLTRKAALDLLTARNGSTVNTISKMSVDGNVAPLSAEEHTMFLTANPQLRRACGPRQIIVTTDFGDNPAPYSNSTEQIVTFSLEAEVSITVPERPELPDAPKKADGTQESATYGSRWGPNAGSIAKTAQT